MSFKGFLSRWAPAFALGAVAFDPAQALAQGGFFQERLGGGTVLIETPTFPRPPAPMPPIAQHLGRTPLPDFIPVGGTTTFRYVDDKRNVLFVGYHPDFMDKETTAMNGCPSTVIVDGYSRATFTQKQLTQVVQQHNPTCVVHYAGPGDNQVGPEDYEQMLGGRGKSNFGVFVSVLPGKRSAFMTDAQRAEPDRISKYGDFGLSDSANPGPWMDNEGKTWGYAELHVKVLNPTTRQWEDRGRYPLDMTTPNNQYPMAGYEDQAMTNFGPEQLKELLCRQVMNNPNLTGQQAFDRMQAFPKFQDWWIRTEALYGRGTACYGSKPIRGSDFTATGYQPPLTLEPPVPNPLLTYAPGPMPGKIVR